MHHVEVPHGAIIRILRSLNCCEGQQPPSNSLSSMKQLVEMKLSLQNDLNNLRSQTNQLPCLVTLDTQIYQLKTIISGLKNQYQIRMHEAQMEMGKVSHAITTQTAFVYRPDQEVVYQRQLEERRRLQQQYHSLVSRVKRIHDQNQNIIEGYGKRYSKR